MRARLAMRWGALALGAALGTGCAVGADAEGARPPPGQPVDAAALAQRYETQVRPLLQTYCVACHGRERHKGDVDFTAVGSGRSSLGERALWRSTAEHLVSLEMPPEKEPKQPSTEERARLLAWIGQLKHLDPPDPGPYALRRLSRPQYVNTMRDLIGLDVPGAEDLPNDGGDTAISPLAMEKYLLAADAMLDQAVVDDQLALRWRAGEMEALIGGVPDGPRPDEPKRTFTGPGEAAVALTLPVDGTYTITVRAAAEQAGREPARLAVRFDAQVVEEFKVLATAKEPTTVTCRAKLRAGRTRLAITFINPFTETPVTDSPAPAPLAKPPGAKPPPAPPKPAPAAVPAKPRVRALTIELVEIKGPPASAPTAAQRRLLGASPGKDVPRREAARAIAVQVSTRAFRRPPSAAELERLLTVFDLADHQHEVFSSAIKLMLKAILVSPQFLYQTPEEGPASRDPIVPLADATLASRLSYFLWSTMPDDELATAAGNGTLHQPAVLAAQVRRMIRDPRSRALADDFAAPWLGLDQVRGLVLDEKKFPQLTRDLRQAMYDEGTQLFDHLLRDDRSLLELIDCDYAFVNAGLAKLYGLDGVAGAKLQKVALTDHNRGGVMGMAGVLAVTSMPGRTSPVKRGKWVLERLLGAPPPPPPPDVAALEKQDTAVNTQLSLRQRTERHRADAQCAGCHRSMDAIGFGLENYDPLGRWRDQDDRGSPVDAVGELPGKLRFATPAQLKTILLARRDEITRALAGRLLAYALGRAISDYDDVALDGIVEAVSRDGYRMDTLIACIVSSYPFGNCRNPLVATGAR